MVITQNPQKSLALAGSSKGNIDPIALFDGWLESQRPAFKLATKRVYKFLWNRFIDWTIEQKKHFAQLNEQDIILFLASLEDTNRQQRERYQLIIYRAYTELQEYDSSLSNPAQPVAINDINATSWRDSTANQAKQFLSLAESKGVIEALQAEHLVLSDNATTLAWPSLWKRRRNAAIIALLLGCGLKPLEVLSLSLESLSLEGEIYHLDTGKFISFTLEEQNLLNRTSPGASNIHAYIHDYNGQHRQLLVPDWAFKSLQLWLQSINNENPKSSDLLFPANRQISKGRPKNTMNPATLSRIVNAWAKQHGFSNISAQKLRNSYGAMCIENGASIADLDAQMGFVASAAGSFRLVAEWRQFTLLHDKTV